MSVSHRPREVQPITPADGVKDGECKTRCTIRALVPWEKRPCMPERVEMGRLRPIRRAEKAPSKS